MEKVKNVQNVICVLSLKKYPQHGITNDDTGSDGNYHYHPCGDIVKQTCFFSS